MTPRWPVAVALLPLCGCVGDDEDTSTPASADVGTCDAMTLTLAQQWDEGDLPVGGDLSHREPGYGIGDLDGDGWLDAFVAWGGGSVVLWNDGAGNLVADADVPMDGGPLPDGSSAAVADLDADGLLDVVLGREWGGIDRVLFNDGDHGFRSVELPGSEGSSQTNSIADADGDGDLDIFVAQMVSDSQPDEILAGDMVGEPNLLYRQTAPGTFELDESAIPQDTNYGMTFEGEWIDYDDDGDLDVYVANAWGTVLVPNQMLVNDGTGHFTETHDCYCELAMNAMGSGLGDANADGEPDLYLSDIGTPHLLVNQGGGTFADATYAMNAEIPPSDVNLSSWGIDFGDLDRDGCADILVSFGGLGQQGDGMLDVVEPDGEVWVDPEEQPDVLLLGDCNGSFARADVGLDEEPRPKNRVVALGDFDRDGRDDVLAAGKSYLMYWKGGGGCDTGLTVALDGDAGNSFGLGSKVTVEAGGRSLTQWMFTGTTHSSSAPELTFGLAGRDVADRVTVVWPDGEVSTETDVPAGRLTISQEGR